MDQIERIIRYLDNQMSDKEQEAFEQERQQNPQLEEAVQTEIKQRVAIRITGSQDLRAKLSQRNQDWTEKDVPYIRPLFYQDRRYLAAAAVVLLLVLSLFIWRQLRPVSLSQKGQEFLAQAEVQLFQTNMGSDRDSIDQVLKQLYQTQQFETLDSMLATFQESNLEGDYYLFLQGTVWIKQGRYLDAAHRFEELPRSSAYYERARWYRVICFLLLEDRAKSVEALQDISQSDHFQQAKAQQLLESLSR